MLKFPRIWIERGARRRIVSLCVFLAPALLLITLPAGAQQSTDPTQLLQQLQNGSGLGESGLGSSGLLGQTNPQQQSLPQDTTLQPVTSNAFRAMAPSRLEQIMSARAGAKVQQFGYDQLGQGRAVTIPQTGAVQDDYILGLGDEVVVSLRGQENSEFRATVDRSGQILLPRLNPISAVGRSFGSFRRDVEDAVHRAYVATNAFVSVARVRQISVLVSGEVNVPGQRIVPGLASAVDALVLSGGIKKTGSLRNIRIERDGRTFVVDLYGLLTNTGSVGNVGLADGDHILVPPLGKTVAVTGMVRRPGIYELPPSTSSVTTHNLLALGGGLEVRGQYRLSVLRVAADGNSQMVAVANEDDLIGDSEILFVQLGASQTVDQAILSGGTALAGQYPIVAGTKLSDVLKAPGALPPAPYTLFGIIARKDPRTLLRTLIAFTPVAVLNGSEDQSLQSNDIIRVLSVNEVRLLTNTVRLYNLRQEAEQAAIRNPLVAVQQSIVGGGTEGQQGQQGQSSNRTALNSDTNADSLSDMQRRDIAMLAEMVDPVTQQALAAQARNQRELQAEQQQAYLEQNPQLQFQVQQQQQLQQLQLQQQQLQQQQLQQQQLQQQRQTQLPTSAGQTIAAQQSNEAPADQVASLSTGASATSYTAGVTLDTPAPNFQTPDTSLGQIAYNREIRNFGDLARQLQVDQLVLVNFLSDHQVGLTGAVSGPGSYFVGPNVPLQDLVEAAGGTSNWADESGVELITTAVDTQSGRSATRRTQLALRQGMLANYVVHPRDQFRFNQVFTDSGLGAATVQGEVRFTGSYEITRGEHLSDLLARAGGLTSTAYPYGTVFLRKSAASAEREGYVRAAKEIEEELVVAMTRIGSDKIDPASFSSLQSFVSELRNQTPVGRIAIAADPSVLAAHPELDPLLEPGDVVYIPQRPSTVTVLGQVMQPGSLAYRSGNTLEDYIDQSGGYSANSDESNTFIVLPDGSARKVETSWLNFDTITLPPGSSIVVPRDVTPLDTRQLILDISGIFSQLAVSAASLAVLSHQ